LEVMNKKEIGTMNYKEERKKEKGNTRTNSEN
jgi:hypothetical protein